MLSIIFVYFCPLCVRFLFRQTNFILHFYYYTYEQINKELYIREDVYLSTILINAKSHLNRPSFTKQLHAKRYNVQPLYTTVYAYCDCSFTNSVVDFKISCIQ